MDFDDFDIDDIEIEDPPKYVDKDLSLTVGKEILNSIMDYAKGDLNHERGGVLLGTLEETENKYNVTVTDMLIAKHTINRSASLTFTHETWLDIDKEIEENYPDKIMVGWFHSHPGYGVFLSGMDMFIENNFFNMPYQIAYVVDPTTGDTGFFGWVDQGQIEMVKDVMYVEVNNG